MRSARRFRPTHPGETLRLDFLPDYGLTETEFASSLQVSQELVHALLAGERAVDADLALRLARFFANSPEYWMALQRDVDFFDAQQVHESMIDAIVPVDPSTSRYLQEREPLPEDVIQELREQLTDIRDATRWVISSSVFSDDETDDDHFAWTYYDVGSDCWAVGMEHGTAFKREWAAKAVAGGLRDGVRVLEVTPAVRLRAARIEEHDHAARKRYLHRSRTGPKLWDPREMLRTEEDMAAYLELAAEESQPGLLSDAVKDVLAAMRELHRDASSAE